MIFQNIESLIRMYLKKVYKIINIKLDDLFIFKYPDNEIKKSSLGKLVNIIKNIINNDTLMQIPVQNCHQTGLNLPLNRSKTAT
jgi:hypothetical protein